MRKCLRDQALLLLYEGEGTEPERAHLKACEACSKRYRRLMHNLEAIGRVLREEPPPQALYHPPRSFYVRWVPLAATLAVTVALFWGGMWVRRVSPPLQEESRNEEVSHFLDEVFSAILSAVNDNADETPSPGFNFAYLHEALGEE